MFKCLVIFWDVREGNFQMFANVRKDFYDGNDRGLLGYVKMNLRVRGWVGVGGEELLDDYMVW